MEHLNKILATLVELKWAIQIAHWNSTGENFYSIHKMFDEFALTIDAHIDAVAERMVMLGEKITPSLKNMIHYSSLEDFIRPDHIKELIKHHETTVILIEKNTYDKVTEDLLTGLLGDLQKQIWFLKSHIV
jgi:starvation-inducible DNA-binding protein